MVARKMGMLYGSNADLSEETVVETLTSQQPPAMSAALLVTQKPRFYGVRTYRTAAIVCLSSKQHLPAQVQWYKASMYNGERKLLEGQITRNSSLTQNAFLYIHNLAEGDSGVYFCKLNNTWGPGTELQVATPVDTVQAEHRSRIKDGLIVLQGLLLAVFLAALLQRKHQLGLATETCDGDLYEELDVYADAEGTEAPWERK
ncbi:unnamed protein product [Lampetra planeri]